MRSADIQRIAPLSAEYGAGWETVAVNDESLAQLVTAVGLATAGLQPPGHGELLQAAVDLARELFAAAACSVALVDDTTSRLVYRVASGAGSAEIVGLSLPLGRGIAGWVASSGSIIAVDDVTADPRWARDVAETTGYVPRTILAAPLETGTEILGVLSVLDRRPPVDAAQAQSDMSLLGLMAQQIALTVAAGAVFADSARLLAATLGAMTEDSQVADALSNAATGSPIQQDLATLAVLFARLLDADPQLAGLAASTLEQFATVARRRSPW